MTRIHLVKCNICDAAVPKSTVVDDGRQVIDLCPHHALEVHVWMDLQRQVSAVRASAAIRLLDYPAKKELVVQVIRAYLQSPPSVVSLGLENGVSVPVQPEPPLEVVRQCMEAIDGLMDSLGKDAKDFDASANPSSDDVGKALNVESVREHSL